MRKIFLPLLLVALSPVAHSEGVQEVEIDAPLSGWHPAEGEDASFSQTINYPASSVNMADDQNISAQIRGKIKNYAAAGKVQQGRLVVNGASMPQRIESDGSFDLLHALIFSLKAATACRSSAQMGKADKKCSFTQRRVLGRFARVYGWFSPGIRTIPTSIFMSLRLTVNMPGTVTQC
ncbi:hypothetical protein EIMP300_38520 [Escherichia coli]|uniref:Uncharacterized protein n=1 Tax=Escherichia coli TaxID=562 RepID=A0A8S0FQ96_ECOLX|nr:hypothetical protein EIMP300_38520 [Escherichia coli]